MKEHHLAAFAMQLMSVNPLAGQALHWVLAALPYATALLCMGVHSASQQNQK